MSPDYSTRIAGVQMTLSAIAYAADTKGAVAIKPAIENQLQGDHTHDGKPYSYATGKDWVLAWGPVVAGDYDNLAYIARDTLTDALSLVLRGTVPDFMSFFEDLPLGQTAFPYSPSDSDTVSGHFLDGMNAILAATDPDSGETLEQFLAGQVALTPDRTIYVTGHSQGGGLTPMMLGWLAETAKGWPGAEKLTLAGYAFAPPTSGNDGFAGWVAGNFSGAAPCFLVMNPLDLVPFGYAGIATVKDKGIPESVPWDLIPVLDAALLWADATGPWEQPPVNQIHLPEIHLMGMSYLDQVEGQHNHNSYLYLLGAPQVYAVGGASPFAPG